jgi:aminotransferase in exopolysaccharide biosynthesis
MNELHNRIADAVRKAIGRNEAGLHEPNFDSQEKYYLSECIDSTLVSSVGSFVNEFELNLANYLGVKRVVAVVNGTAALQIALLLSGVKPGDEVIVPALSFVATANAVTYLNATPHFVDSNIDTLGMDPTSLRIHLRRICIPSNNGLVNKNTGATIKAIVPMHTFGHPCQLDELKLVAEEFGLALVEDAAESLGSLYKGNHTGTIGIASAISFNGNKIITTGGGGAIATNEDYIADTAKHLTTTAKVPHRWEFLHDRVGFNYRMPNLNAALGCAQLTKLNSFIARKRNLANRYFDAFKEIPEVTIFQEPKNCHSNYWLQTLLLNKPNKAVRDSLLNDLNAMGICVRPVWNLLHELPMYSKNPRSTTPVSEAINSSCVNLPSSSFLGQN